MLLVELFGWVFGHVDKCLGWLEWCSVQFSELLHLADEFVGAVVVNPSEWTAAEWREAETEDCSDVALQRVVEDLLFQTEDGFVDESVCKMNDDYIQAYKKRYIILYLP